MVSRIGRGDLRAVFFRRIAGIEAILPIRFRTRLIARNARMRRRPDRGAFRHLDLRWALPNQDSKHFQSNPRWKLIDDIRDII